MANHNFDALHAAMQAQVDHQFLPGVSTALFQDRDVVDTFCCGFADKEASTPLREDHIFRIFSNTKLMTSCAVPMLFEEGRIQWDDPIESYIPELGARQAEAFKKLFEHVDVIISPTEPLTAWRGEQKMIKIDEKEESVLAASWRLTYPFNLTGLPAISVPCGFDREGMPIGLQIAGTPFDEAAILHCAALVERTVGINRRPELG